MAKLQGFYQPLLQKAIRVKYWLVGITTAVFVVTVILFSRMGGEFIPQLQEGDFAFHCILPQGSSLNQSIETSMQASRILKEFDEVKWWSERLEPPKYLPTRCRLKLRI
jgi:cobalt-zinc-cadmium resistance protein CzcA